MSVIIDNSYILCKPRAVIGFYLIIVSIDSVGDLCSSSGYPDGHRWRSEILLLFYMIYIDRICEGHLK